MKKTCPSAVNTNTTHHHHHHQSCNKVATTTIARSHGLDLFNYWQETQGWRPHDGQGGSGVIARQRHYGRNSIVASGMSGRLTMEVRTSG